ncbi:MAG: DUF3098 domain-containing protein [Bacteroidales bacterium]|nr:DUF3098 domain-containing protein [Bacteroidales bacterium]
METKKKNIPTKPAANSSSKSEATPETFVFGPINYILLAAGIVLLGLGYILLSGGGSDDPNVFNADMFDSRRLVVAPLIIVAGLVVEICAIMFRKKENNN